MAEAYNPLNIPPGVYANGTAYQAKGRYNDAHLVRFFEQTIRPHGGWRVKSTTAMVGAGRAIITWKDNLTAAHAAIGTSHKLYAMDRLGTLYDITPFEDSGTLPANPFATTNLSNIVTVNDPAHGRAVGDIVVFSGAATVAGLNMNGTWVVATTPTTGAFTFVHTGTANATVAAGGGAAVTFGYELSSGLVAASSVGGYGSGVYGAGAYGTPRPVTSDVVGVRVWTLDTFGQVLIATPGFNGDIYQWLLSTTTRAVKITNSPTCRSLICTEERILMALGALNNPRKVMWCDQEDTTDWTPSALNLAGDFDLQTGGELMQGSHVRGGILLLTDLDAHFCTFLGYPLVYGFERVQEQCGAISQNCMADLDQFVVWMGTAGFWLYNGFVSALPCELSDYIFSDLNPLQRSKVACEVISQFSEVIWYYPSGSATENDRYVTWNWKENHWSKGFIVRFAGADRGVFEFSLRVAGDGYIYEHEVGFDYIDSDTPYLQSGPLEQGNGERTMDIRDYIPDEKTVGDAEITLYGRNFPNASETIYGPFTAANPRNLRITARQLVVRYTFTGGRDSRIGVPRLAVQAGSKR